MGDSTTSCDVCGRTILAGERVRAYLAPEGERSVCELCVGRAERFGWVRAGDAAVEGPAPRRQRRGFSHLIERWRRRSAASPAAAQEGDAEPPDESEPPQRAENGARAENGLRPPPEPDRSPDPAAPGRTTGRLAPDPSPLGPFERATARFNVSRESHTVAGLIRTLGKPWVSVGASAGAANEVRITVAWELSWYQWGVDLGDELRPVFQIDKGFEISQLDAAARQWNAVADEDGRIAVGAPGGAGAGRGEAR